MTEENEQDSMLDEDLFIEIKIQRNCEHELPLPELATEGSAGYDLRALGEYIIHPQGRALIKTGFNWEIPDGLAGLICPRSGLALKHGVTVLNAPGIIDSDYRGDVGVILINHGTKVFHVTPDMRIAQLVLSPIWNRVHFNEVLDQSKTDRGLEGFGSSGTH